MANIDVQNLTGTDGQQIGVSIPFDRVSENGTENYRSLEEAGIEISERTGLPVIQVPSNSRPIALEDVKKLEDEW